MILERFKSEDLQLFLLPSHFLHPQIPDRMRVRVSDQFLPCIPAHDDGELLLRGTHFSKDGRLMIRTWFFGKGNRKKRVGCQG